MIYFADNIDSLIHALESMKKRGITRIGKKIDENKVDSLLQVEYVFVDKDGNLLGDEANDYKPKEGDIPVALIS